MAGAGRLSRRALLGGGLVAAGASVAAWRWATGSMTRYRAWVAGERALPDVPATSEALVGLARFAPNGHNAQPWRFAIGDARIEITPDLARRTPVVDPDDHHLYVSLGAAAETMAIAGAALGQRGEVEEGDGRLAFVHGASAPVPDPLADAIPRRQSTRGGYDGQPLAAEDLAALATAAAAVPGVRVVLVTEAAARDRLRDLVLAGNDAQMGDAAFMAELRDWIRFNPREAMARGDGLFAAASGNPNVPTVIGRALFSRFVTVEGERARYATQMASLAGCAVFFGERDDPAGWMRVGRACQRFCLEATARDIRTAFVNQPVEVPALRPELASLAGEPGLRPDLLVRFGRGPRLPYSPRRPVGETMA